MYRIDVHTGKMRHYTRDNSELKRNGVISVFFDSQNRMWVSTITGTSVYSIDSGNLNDLEADFNLFGYKTVSFFEDHRGSIWLATEGDGICAVSPDMSVIHCYSTGDGLSSNFVTAITEGPNDVFWISTSRGMSRFEKESESFSNYTLADGLPSLVFNRGAVINEYDSTGKIWFGSEGGLFNFNPDSLSMRNAHTKVVLTDFYLAGQVFDPELGTFLDGPVDQMTDIHLPGGYNSFGFRFVALNYQNPVDNKYYYRLVGKDDNWQVAEGNHVSFSEIKPGNYIFEVCLSDRIPSGEDVITSVNVFVKAQFYERPLFLLVVIVFLSGIFLLGWFVLNRLNKELVSLRTGVKAKGMRPRYESSYLSSERRKEIEEALVKYINESKAYKNPDLNLNDLAHSIDCSSHYISQVINQNLKQSYSDFINNYRIDAVKSCINDSSYDKYTLFAIAQECGYKSKASFYRAFRKVAGQTPMEYYAMIKKKD
jgi:AraC-like DNA-binding protein